ncbi:glycosyltransferase [Thermodesulfobacteriota bacterium]
MNNKTVLIITQLYPPLNKTGALRAAFFSKYLPLFGWQPLILTSALEHVVECVDYDMLHGLPEEEQIFRVPNTEEDIEYDHISRIKRFNRKLFYPILTYHNKFTKNMIAQLESITQAYRINTIFATSGPPATHYIGSRAHKNWGIPWIADFRDILEQFIPDKFHDRWYLKRLIREQHSLVSSASELITVSHSLADQLENKLGRHITVIPNGFDDEMMPPIKNQTFPSFTLTYTGSIWDPRHRNPIPLFQALDMAIQKNFINQKDLEIRFIGTESEMVKAWQNQFLCGNKIKLLPRIPYKKCLREQKESCILIHLSHGKQEGILTGKLFEYLGARRPIISIPGDNNEVDSLLHKTGAGVACRDVGSIIQNVCKWYKEWCKNKKVSYYGIEVEILKFSRKEQTRKLADILDKLPSANC